MSGAGMCLLVYSLTSDAGAAVFAGIVFAFLPYRFDHYAHLQLQSAQWMPLALWAAHRTLVSERMLFARLTGVFFVLNALSCLYYGVFFSLFFPVVIGIAGVAVPETWRAATKRLGVAALIAAILLAPFAAAYAGRTEIVRDRTPAYAQRGQARPIHYLAVPPESALYGTTLGTLGDREKALFPGAVAVALAACSLWPPVSVVRLAYGAGLAFAVNESLGYSGVGYGWLYDHLLPYRGIRIPARWGLLAGLSVAVLAGFGLARVLERVPPRAGRAALAVVACGLALVEYRQREVPLRHAPRELPAVYERFNGSPPTVLVELPLEESTFPMYFSTFHWQRLVNGYSGHFPPWFIPLVGATTTASFPNDAALAELRAHHVEYILVHRALFRDRGLCGRIVAAMDQRPDLTLVGRYELFSAESRVYHLKY